MDYRKHRKAILKTSYRCNNNCIFCHALDKRDMASLGLEEIERKIQLCKDAGVQTVIISGGEPTIRKDFFEILAMIRENGMRPGIITNGRMLAYRDFAERYTDTQPEYTYISLHGHNRRLHDEMTGTHAFLQTLSGIKNICGKVENLTINTVITSENMSYLDQIVALATKYFLPCRLKFSLIEPKGAAVTGNSRLIPQMVAAASAVQEAMAFFEDRAQDTESITGCDGFTPCTISEFIRYRADLITDNILYMSETYEDSLYPTDNGERTYVENCIECSEKTNCPGIYPEYLRRTEGRIAKTIEKPASNSFLYTFKETREPAKKDAALPCGGAGLELDLCRDVALVQNGSIQIYKTSTGDFGPEAVRNIKFDRNQVYLDIVGKNNNIDFRRDLIKLEPHPGCKKCSYFNVCSRLFVLLENDIFSEQEEMEKELIEELSGRVLDVGCGMPHFKSILEQKVERGEIEYLGIDIDQQESGGLRIINKSIQDFDPGDKVFDTILVLRSYNHFRELRKTFEKIVGLLKTGGRLLVIDNSVYAILKKTAGEGEGGSDRKFEHFRNHSSEEAIHFFQSLNSLKILRHIPVSPAGPNQWLLLLEKQPVPDPA